MTNKLTILIFALFCVYCGYDFAQRKAVKEISRVDVVWQTRVDSVKAVHSNLLNLHRKHIDKCQFKYSK